MINITEMSRELNPIERYLLTQSPRIESVKDIEDGAHLFVKAWCKFQDVNDETGEIKEITSLLCDDNKSVSFQSKTFGESFMNMWNNMSPTEDDGLHIIKISGTSKAGRQYVDCDLDIDHYMNQY